MLPTEHLCQCDTMSYCLLAGAVILWLLYKKWTSIFSQWESRGIPSIPGSFPFGTDKDFSMTKTYFGHIFEKIYRQGAPYPFVGYYDVRMPVLLIRDPEYVKLVLAKEFSHFKDRQGFEISKKDYLSHHLFNLEGDKWKAVRVKLSPTFTSGKMKGMFPLFVKCAETLDSLLLTELEKPFDVKDVFGRFATDVICSCAFGLDVDSMHHSESEFRKIGQSSFKVRILFVIIAFFFKVLPFLPKLIGFRFTPYHIEKFIMNVVNETIDQREKNNVKRGDFLDILMQLKGKDLHFEEFAGEEKEIVANVEVTPEFMAAQCFVFFLAGFETSSSVQTYCLYELALNPEIQERLHKEIESTIEKHGELSYQAVQEMEYLDMVVSETIRKYPTLSFLMRVCTKSLTVPNGQTIEKGDRIMIPVWSLHHDPEYFPEPDKFDPERFSAENKDSIKPFTYLPFGEGPRICIGVRFGLLQTKMGLITVLRKFRVDKSDKTPPSISFLGASFLTTPKETIYLKLSKRT